MILSKLIIWLVFYSFIGWVYETIICSLEAKKLIKRGFLYGLYCPVYGFGAILDILVIGQVNNSIILFVAGMILTCLLEYFTSWLLEKLFHARWWNYSYMKYHIKGRICLAGALVFGLFSVLLIKFIHPFVVNLTNKISNVYLIYISIILLVILTIDLLFTTIRLFKFNENLKEIQKLINRKIIIPNIKYNLVKDKIKHLIDKLTKHDKRLLKSFPRFNSTVYKDAINKIREYLNKFN